MNSPIDSTVRNMLDTFDHVVVLMFENRSFDNLLGGLYPDGVPADAPLGRTFEGVVGKEFSNPIPDTVQPPTDGKRRVQLRSHATITSHSPMLAKPITKSTRSCST